MFGLASSFEPPPGAYVLFFLALLALALFARNRNVEDARRLLSHGWTARGIGLLVVAFGLGAGYIIAAEPISQALAGRRIVQIHRAALALPGLFLFAGLTLLVAGKRSPEIFIARPGEPTPPLRHAFTVASIVIAMVLAFGLDPLFKALGYRVFR